MNQQSATKLHKNSAEIPLLKKLALKRKVPLLKKLALKLLPSYAFLIRHFAPPLLQTQLFPLLE